MANPEVSIGIATCGRPQCIRRCIRSIKQYVKVPYKIIILDNTKAFTDKLDNQIEGYKKYADIFIEIDDRKIGCSESNNLIAEACDTPYLMHLDDDCYLISDVVSAELDAINKYDADIVSCLWKDTYLSLIHI